MSGAEPDYSVSYQSSKRVHSASQPFVPRFKKRYIIPCIFVYKMQTTGSFVSVRRGIKLAETQLELSHVLHVSMNAQPTHYAIIKIIFNAVE